MQKNKLSSQNYGAKEETCWQQNRTSTTQFFTMSTQYSCNHTFMYACMYGWGFLQIIILQERKNKKTQLVYCTI